ncbi:MAG: hypothetical protein JWN09_865 [Microbacteriaceae bacterium]|nr:hypothetical protein [Microbacteriaceae bacterium]
MREGQGDGSFIWHWAHMPVASTVDEVTTVYDLTS